MCVILTWANSFRDRCVLKLNTFSHVNPLLWTPSKLTIGKRSSGEGRQEKIEEFWCSDTFQVVPFSFRYWLNIKIFFSMTACVAARECAWSREINFLPHIRTFFALQIPRRRHAEAIFVWHEAKQWASIYIHGIKRHTMDTHEPFDSAQQMAIELWDKVRPTGSSSLTP